jgi:hypothetical protein
VNRWWEGRFHWRRQVGEGAPIQFTSTRLDRVSVLPAAATTAIATAGEKSSATASGTTEAAERTEQQLLWQ